MLRIIIINVGIPSVTYNIPKPYSKPDFLTRNMKIADIIILALLITINNIKSNR